MTDDCAKNQAIDLIKILMTTLKYHYHPILQRYFHG